MGVGRLSPEDGRGASEPPSSSRCTRRTALRLIAVGTGVALLPVAHAAPSQANSAPDRPRTPSSLDTITAVDLAGRQRALSQRMTKAYLMVGQGISPDFGRNILDDSRRQFEAQLGALRGYQPNGLVRDALSALETEWRRFKVLLDAAPSRDRAEAMYDANEALMQSAHRTTLAYERVSFAPTDHLVNLVGRQCMLAHRMAKFFFYRTWGVHDGAAEMELDNSRAHFTAVFIQLHSSPLASPAIKAQVAQLQREWEPYKVALLASRNPLRMRQYAIPVAMLSEERMLVGTEDLVALMIRETRA
jgi:PilJ/NarX-like methyl-accepting chemotaxis transducer